MFVRINVLRINLDNVVSYDPISDEIDKEIRINYVGSTKSDIIKCKDQGEIVQILVRLDKLLGCKGNLIGRK